MKILIIPDSFKGTLTAEEVASLIEEGLLKEIPDAEIIKMPVADGGEGSANALGATIESVNVHGPFFDECKAFLGFLGECAVVETASAAGLPLVNGKENPEKTSTYGVGELILKALECGKRDILLCLGGSATNDCGCGMACALGVRFLDKSGKEFIPTGGTLKDICDIDISGLDKRIKESKIRAMCDVTNPLYGENGAAHVFAPQKGANADCVRRLDEGLVHIAKVIEDKLSLDVSLIPGAGAAGGMGAGVVAFLGGKLISGIDAVLDINGFEEKLIGADLIITGEGRFDSQSMSGKVISGIARRAGGVPIVAICGSADRGTEKLDNITAVFSIQSTPLPFEEAIKHSKKDIYFTARNIARLVSRFKNN